MIENKIDVELICIKEIDYDTSPIFRGDKVVILQDSSHCPLVTVNGNDRIPNTFRLLYNSGVYVLPEEYINETYFRPYDEIKELREGITVKEVNEKAEKLTLPDMGSGLPNVKEAGDSMKKALNPDGYQIAEVAKIIIDGEKAVYPDELLDEPAYLKIAKEVAPRLKELFSIGTFDEAVKAAYQEQVEDGLKRIKEIQEKFEAYQKNDEELDKKQKEKIEKLEHELAPYRKDAFVKADRLTESETNLEQAIDANEKMLEALNKKEDQIDSLISIVDKIL